MNPWRWLLMLPRRTVAAVIRLVDLSQADVRLRLEALERKLPPTLDDFGVNVVGCSMCRVVPKNKTCPGCGNKGVAPVRRRRKVRR